MTEKRTPESLLSGAVMVSDLIRFIVGVVVGLLNSECPQQNRAYESKHGAYRQHIELQGKVHGSASLVDREMLARNVTRLKSRAEGTYLPVAEIAYRTCANRKRLIARSKRNPSAGILTVQNLPYPGFFMANLRQLPPVAPTA
ncbi:MAG TPA: hypothetical protein VFB29_06470 [Pseudolabrys sp.]|nr:hypothetical protein [Pseudolabrys sp.]